MMEIVIGVDAAGTYRPVIGMIERLGFAALHITLVHSAPTGLPLSSLIGRSPDVERKYVEGHNVMGEAALHEATALLCGKDLPCDAFLTHGEAAMRLVETAERQNADLLAVNATRVGTTQGSWLGSVSRALATDSATSLLVTKGHGSRRTAFRAVFATDHSPYSHRCLNRFLEMNPRGIEEIHVFSAWDLNDREAELMGKNLASLGGDAERWIEETVSERNDEVCSRLEKAGYRTLSHVVRGRPNDRLRCLMMETQSDLLVVGSQGHGAIGRSHIGSVSLHQVAIEPYAVLVIRPREDA